MTMLTASPSGAVLNHTPPELTASNLSCGYPRSRRLVLRDLDLEMRRGRFFCIIGPNGGGKTTLLRTLAGLLPPVSGTVRIGGTPLHALAARERARRLSVVLTQFTAPGYLSVERFVELGRHPYTGFLARLSSEDRRAVGDALDQTGIAALRHRWMAEISDGERQRAAVARALAQAADVMILDEPTAFLDVAGRATVMSTLRRIAHSTDRLIVTSSHDVELVLRTADVVALIGVNGTLRLGSPEDLVLSGAIQALFPADTLSFDARTGTFRLPAPTGTPVRLVGEGLVAEWTAHAIERVGRPVIRPAATDGGGTTGSGGPSGGGGPTGAGEGRHDGTATKTPTVTVHEGDRPAWSVGIGTESGTVHSLETLVEVLRE
ncbi:MAG: ABC transporter ATP-binding protein [bacterium]